MIIYLVTNTTNGKIYIGKTTTSLSRRWRAHLAAASRGSRTYLHYAIAKYGRESFTVEKIAETLSEADLARLEIHFIEFYRANDHNVGYNLTVGGEGTSGHRKSPEEVEKTASWHRGKKRSVVTCEKLAIARHSRPKKKLSTHCRRGHLLSGDNLYLRPGDGARVCLTCFKLVKLGLRGRTEADAGRGSSAAVSALSA